MKKISLVLLGLLSTIIVLGACGSKGSSEGEGGKSKDVKIQFMTSSVQEERLNYIQKMIDDFEAKNKGIKVEIVPVEEEQYNTNIITFAQSGKMPAVIEVGNEFVKKLESEELVDKEAMTSIIEKMGQDHYYDGILNLVATEDGKGYLAAPISGWVQGIWYHPSQFKNANIKVPENWAELLTAAEKLTDPANKKYGIALPTVASAYSEQSFSQFALSNEANLLTLKNDKVKSNLESPAMLKSLEFYKELSKYTMPGSNDTTEVKDSFVNGSAAMAIYSTYILPTIYANGDPNDIGFIMPKEKDAAVFGSLTSLTMSAGLDDAQKEAATAFIKYMTEPETMTRWVLMAPGGAQPVSESVTKSEDYQNNEVVQSFGALSTEVAASFSSIRTFGMVDNHNLAIMGDISASQTMGTLINQITVQDISIDTAVTQAEKSIDKILNQ